MRKYYTTHQVAKLFGVSLATVVNWTNSGRMKAHRTAGGHRRIPVEEVVALAREHGFRLPREIWDSGDGPRRVLVVDDESDFASVVAEYLTASGGLSVETAGSGFDAGLAVPRFRPHLVLIDLMMPDMDGFEVLRALRSHDETRHIPVIACSGYRGEELEKRLDEAQFDGFVDKPVKLEDLQRLIQDVLNRAS